MTQFQKWEGIGDKWENSSGVTDGTVPIKRYMDKWKNV
jgi:hypothetical protein